MLRTTIHHGRLNIELCEDGSLQLARDDRPESIRLSGSEWIYLQKVALLHGWPVAPPTGKEGGMTQDPRDKIRYCWKCRKRIGRGPGAQTCAFCRTYNSVHGLAKNLLAIPDIEERVAYYSQRAALELDLFAESPYRRLPGAHNRALEGQPKAARTPRRVAATHQVE